MKLVTVNLSWGWKMSFRSKKCDPNYGPIHLLNTRKYCGNTCKYWDNTYKYWANTWKMCSPASVILTSIVTLLVSFEAVVVYFKAYCRKITLKLTSKVDIYRNSLQNCFKTYKYCDNTCEYYTCKWTHFSSIGTILVGIISILTSIATILASIKQVNTPLVWISNLPNRHCS